MKSSSRPATPTPLNLTPHAPVKLIDITEAKFRVDSYVQCYAQACTSLSLDFADVNPNRAFVAKATRDRVMAT